MSSLKLLGISVFSAVLFSACASGKGSFDLDDVNHNATVGMVKPTYQDDTSNPRRDTVEQIKEINQPSLGYAVEVPRRNTAPKPTMGTIEDNAQVAITADKVKPINVALNQVSQYFTAELEKHNKHDDSYDIDYSHNNANLAHKRDLTYVRLGYVLGNRRMEFTNRQGLGSSLTQDIFPGGWAGYVFYQGSSPAVSLPTQTVTYKGYWDFVSDADKNRNILADDFTQDNNPANALPGNAIGATSMDEAVNRRHTGKGIGHSAEFTADFANKKLSGSLNSNGYIANADDAQTVNKRYNITADIKGNRFKGSATAENKSHSIFGKDSENLEGGFFGPNAEELAGKFLTDNNSLFAVFSGKRDNNLPADQLQTLFDAEKIDSGSLKKNTLDTFGNAAYLVLDGRQFPLLPEGKTKFADMKFIETVEREHQGKQYSVTVCCNNLDYVKFGSYGEKQTTGGITQIVNGALFLQGERTPLAAMPTGQAHYRGTWQANFLSKNNRVGSVEAGDAAHASRSRFDFDFGSKTFTGKLIDTNGSEDKPAFTLSGSIDKNGFTGRAKTDVSGFNIDKGGSGVFVHLDAEVKGAFFGPNGAEIGGTLHSAEDGKDKVGGVFGGKRQVVK
ncbi:transferrin-binding protein-like solute binding protein [Wielerella bovis]|uniref:transferrin-binding protein-like solute binding protein n=1 Tax=Wielerella bovis TaxID=2917790 RepID=UPI0020192342|nr:transferrin-binding protein-like solute binding protein [Wielerella bovis]MCG7657225.1 transferrin-binding protein-like solute binding protein [Wielerella bovis]MCG7659447.1 transferrin-binding protein-like solute binding protein [Wielerella bovis]